MTRRDPDDNLPADYYLMSPGPNDRPLLVTTTCPTCAGTGAPQGGLTDCPACHGEGQLLANLPLTAEHAFDPDGVRWAIEHGKGDAVTVFRVEEARQPFDPPMLLGVSTFPSASSAAAWASGLATGELTREDPSQFILGFELRSVATGKAVAAIGLDWESSASRQHRIDTGSYLRTGEAVD